MKKKYGLIGYPLTHSFSKQFFTEKFEKENVDAVYENFEIEDISWFQDIARNNPELVGLNVTIPYKQVVINFLHELDEAAEEIGAVNTIKIKHTGERIHLKGFNTDIWGFETSVKKLPQKSVNIRNRRCFQSHKICTEKTGN
jgi:shikimate dehydrogenase